MGNVFRKEDMLTVPELAKRLGCSRRHAYRLVELGPSSGGVLGFRYGTKRCYRVPLSEVDRLKQGCKIEEV